MHIGYIGLGKMGKNMVLRLLEQDIGVVAWNRSPGPLQEVTDQGAIPAKDFSDIVTTLRKTEQKIVLWLMLPAGSVIDEMLTQLTPFLLAGDIVIDGANSFYKDTQRRAQNLKTHGITYIDVAVSGGPTGARTGACLMIGGDSETVFSLRNLFEAIATYHAYEHLGPVGAGHFAKMVHNGIEYGMMQAIAEGTAVLQASPFAFDLSQVFAVYNNRSVIESRLVGWTQEALKENPTLSGITSTIAHSGEGEWTIHTAKELGISVPVIEESFQVRLRSATEPENFRNKVVSALRGKFGGHSTK